MQARDGQILQAVTQALQQDLRYEQILQQAKVALGMAQPDVCWVETHHNNRM